MTRRSGVTLVEVLVAIFVMGIGLIALLTLFPIGMLRVAQALGDARSVESADNAHSIAIAQNIANDPLVITDNTAANPDFFKNNGQAGAPDADPYGESYAVFVDPIGFYAKSGNQKVWVGNFPAAFTPTAIDPRIRRFNAQKLTGQPRQFRMLARYPAIGRGRLVSFRERFDRQQR